MYNLYLKASGRSEKFDQWCQGLGCCQKIPSHSCDRYVEDRFSWKNSFPQLWQVAVRLLLKKRAGEKEEKKLRPVKNSPP